MDQQNSARLNWGSHDHASDTPQLIKVLQLDKSCTGKMSIKPGQGLRISYCMGLFLFADSRHTITN